MTHYNLISLFSGCGGNSLGYTMTGRYKILIANEFIPSAKKTYEANFPNTPVLPNDIRDLTGDIILSAINRERKDIDIMDGSPPCKAFTTSGKTYKGWGKKEHYSEGVFQRTDDLYFEYIRLIRDIQPKVFVAENVKGLVSGVSKGYFNNIFKEMQNAGYIVKASVLTASHYGVAQRRERVFFIGIRKDLWENYEFDKYTPFFPKPTVKKVKTFANVLKDYNVVNSDWELMEARRVPEYIKAVAAKVKSGQKGSDVMNGSYFSLVRLGYNKPAPTVLSISYNSKDDEKKLSRRAGMFHPTENRYLTISELKAVSSFPQDFKLLGNFAQQWERIARAVPPLLMKAIAQNIADNILDRIT